MTAHPTSHLLKPQFLLGLLFTNAAHADFNTDLIEAAKAGDTAIVEQELKQGADVNAKSKKGTTALMVAAERGHTEIVDILKRAGARR